ncbi:MAG: cytochrome c biogenesis protein CcsA [Rikenellaceae bacterium]
MKKIAFTIYGVITLLLAAITIVEKFQGTQYVQQMLYSSWWFCALWGAMAMAGFIYIVEQKLHTQKSSFLLHLSFLLILFGALLTTLFGQRGYIHLRVGESLSCYVNERDNMEHSLPFALSLDKFEVINYPGTTTPADYKSTVRVDGARQRAISMNNILRERSFRIYQTSFDKDHQGAILSVNYDPWGVTVTYIGYALLFLSMLLMLLDPKGGFRRLLSHPLLRNKALLLLLFILCSFTAWSHPASLIDREKADSLAYKAVLYQGRVAPFNTVARDVMIKLYGRARYEGLTPEQVVASYIINPDEWSKLPLIKIKDGELRRLLGMEGEYISLSDLYVGTEYRLEQFWNPEELEAKRSPLQKAVAETDEKASLMVMLARGTLFKPADPRTVDHTRLRAEVIYNRYNSPATLFKIHLAIGLITFILLLITTLTGRTFNRIFSFSRIQVYHSLAYLTLVMGLRWYVAGHIPLSNGYETMIFVSWSLLLLSLLLYKKVRFMPAVALLLSGFTLLVSTLSTMNPQITSLMPVLASPWLTFHVSLIMIAYALFGFMMFNGVVALVLHYDLARYREAIDRLEVVSRIMLYPAIFALTAGIFLGAIWANLSWGRYWGWDPKEVWALITMLIYGVSLHRGSFKVLRNSTIFHIYMVLAFMAVLMTYFGVNYLLGGLHSYAN